MDTLSDMHTHLHEQKSIVTLRVHERLHILFFLRWIQKFGIFTFFKEQSVLVFAFFFDDVNNDWKADRLSNFFRTLDYQSSLIPIFIFWAEYSYFT